MGARATGSGNKAGTTTSLAVGVLGALLAVGCASPIAAALDEPDANRVVTTLDHVGIDATKEADPQAEGKYRVTVARDDAARALVALAEEELPRPKPRGLLDAVDKGALVPSAASEQAQLVAGMAGELEKTLSGIDGVLAARVHLSVPPREPLRDGPREKATASVLLEHRGTTPPITEDAVRRLVAGGVSGLDRESVHVILVARGARPAPKESQLGHVGPLAVARSSVRPLQIALGGLMALSAALAAVTLLLYTRLSRARAEAAVVATARPDPRSPGDPRRG